MPQAFTDCYKSGGKVITKRVNARQYIHVCYPKGSGSPISGEVKEYKKVLKGKK